MTASMWMLAPEVMSHGTNRRGQIIALDRYGFRRSIKPDLVSPREVRDDSEQAPPASPTTCAHMAPLRR